MMEDLGTGINCPCSRLHFIVPKACVFIEAYADQSNLIPSSYGSAPFVVTRAVRYFLWVNQYPGTVGQSMDLDIEIPPREP